MADATNIEINYVTSADLTGSNQVLDAQHKIQATSAGEALQDIAVNSAEALKEATKLAEIIKDLNQKLDGVDSDAAQELKQELQELADTINSVDPDKLAKLDNIIDKIGKSGAKLPVSQIKETKEELKQATNAAQKFKELVSNQYRVKVNVDDTGDKQGDLERKLDAVGQANSILASGKDFLKTFKDEGTAADLLRNKVMAVMKAVRTAGPDTSDEIKKHIDEMMESIDMLPQRTQAAVGESIKGIRDMSNRLTDTVKSKDTEVAEKLNAASTATKLLHGDFEGLGRQMLDMLKNTKAWTATIGKVGKGRALAALGLAMAGISIAVQQAVAGFRQLRQIAQENEITRLRGTSDSASGITNAIENQAYRAELDTRGRSTELNAERRKRANYNKILMASKDQAAAAGDALDYSAQGREDRGIENARFKEDREFQERRIKQREDVAMAEDALKKAKDRQNMMSGAFTAVANLQEDAERNYYKAGNYDKSGLANYMVQLGANLGVSTSKEEYEQRLTAAKDASDEIAKIKIELMKKVKQEAESIKEAEENLAAAIEEESVIEAEHKNIIKQRAKEDEDRLRERARANHQRDREVKLLQRDMAETDRENQRQNAEQTQSYEEKKRTTQKMIGEYSDKEMKIKERLDELVKSYGDKDEGQWSEEDKTRRSELEADWQHYRQKRIAEEQRYAGMIKSGDTDGSSWRRMEEERAWDEREARRQQLRDMRNKRRGWSGQMADAKNEESFWRKELAGDQKDLDAIRKKYTDASGKFHFERMTDEDRATESALQGYIVRDKSNLRNAETARFDLSLQGDQKELAMRDKYKESNRLTNIGLAGGGQFKWGQDTARNTKTLVDKVERIINKMDNNGKKNGGGATFSA